MGFLKCSIWALTLTCLSHLTSQEQISVTCDAGTFVGRVRTQQAFNNNYKINRFLGIPYAEPPTGELRFRKPIRKSRMSEHYDAGQFGASCHGIFMPMEGKRKPDPFKIVESEDCLFLNIFAPNEVGSKKLPVIIVMHGGSFNLGTSTLYPGDIFAAYGKVVVVTINYRLNIWGFLSTGDEASPGNYGLWDQQMAIEWVKDNIAAFGGDPDMVTINGYSAGSASAIYQAMYSGNKGNFRRIFAQSGSPLCPWAFNSNPRKTATKIGHMLKCNTKDSHELVACIKSKSAEEITKTLNKGEVMLHFPMELLTVVDGEFVKHPPSELLNEHSDVGSAERQALSNYDLLTGVTINDGALMVTSCAGVHDTEHFTINKDEFAYRDIPNIAEIMFPGDASKVVKDLLMNEYFPWESPDNDTIVRDAFINLSTDYVFGIEAVRTANVHAAAKKRNTFFYVFDALPDQHLLATPSWLKKPNHCDDLTFLYGHDSDSGYISWTMNYTIEAPAEWELEFSKAYITMVANFMASGDPNIPNDVRSHVKDTWPKYTRNKQEAFRLSHDWNQPVIQRPFARAVNFWYHALPAVIRETNNGEAEYCEKPEV